MNNSLSQQEWKTAYHAALAMRRESWLAQYPRKLKLFCAALCLLVLATPFYFLLSQKGVNPEQPSVVAEAKRTVDAPVEAEPSVQTAPPTRSGKGAFHQPETEAEKAAAAENDSAEMTRRMARLPITSLIEETAHGFLPVIASDGRKPWQVYARPFNHQDPRPRIALVIGDLGLSRADTDAVLHRLPAGVTLAFDAQAEALTAWLERARQEGHETILSLPMEPHDYPRSDPGPQTLLTSLPQVDITQRLHHFMGKGMGYVGVTTLSGSRFSADSDKVAVVMEGLKKRGLVVFDARLTGQSVVDAVAEKMAVPVAVNTRVIDKEQTPEMIDAALLSLEQTARVEGSVVALASAYPVTLERLAMWLEGLSDRGFVLAPLTAVVR